MQFPADLLTFTEKALIGKTSFFVQCKKDMCKDYNKTTWQVSFFTALFQNTRMCI